MTTLKLPLGYLYQGFDTNGGHSFTASGHTVILPKVVKYSRRNPNASGAYGTVFKVIRGIAQTDGSVRNAIATVDFRCVPGMVAADFTAVLQAIKDGLTTGTISTNAAEMLQSGIVPSSQSDVSLT